MSTITIGVDLAKQVFSVCSVDSAGRRLSANIAEGVHLGAALMWARLE